MKLASARQGEKFHNARMTHSCLISLPFALVATKETLKSYLFRRALLRSC